MQDHVHLPDRSAAVEAAELLDHLGDAAAGEAKARADHSRNVGNVVLFCRWRQIGRMIAWLSSGRDSATIH